MSETPPISRRKLLRERAQRLRREATGAERRAWSLLRKRRLGGFKFCRQVVISSSIVDFLCWERRLVIEIDGRHHEQRRDKDRKRDFFLKERGFDVIRFWNEEVLDDPAGVEYAIATRLGLDWKRGWHPFG